MACKACLKVAMLAGVLLLLVMFWAWCSQCVVWATAIVCTASIFGAPFLSPGCLAGVVFTLMNGIHLGSGPVHFDVRWDT